VAGISFRGVEKVFAGGVRALAPLDLDVRHGELLVLLGPSGCGKTTVLRLLAGLETPTRGEIHVGGRRVDQLPPSERDVAMIFQDYALYPHKSVAENLGFPLRMRRTPRPERERRVREVAELLDIGPLLEKRPGQLSGGQQQRVAIGRALVREPAAFLMDEPLSNLDAQLRARIRTELGALQRRLGITTLFVTHDQNEAMTLGDRVAVLRAGRLHQLGTPDELYAAPADLSVAAFVGEPSMNLLPGALERVNGAWSVRFGRAALELPARGAAGAADGAPREEMHGGRGPASDAPPQSRRVTLGLRPEALRLVDADAADALLAARVQAVETLGPERIVRLEAGDGESIALTVRIPRRQDPPRVDQRVGVAADASQAHVFGADGRRLGSYGSPGTPPG
jgi:multiple sugar transport system ATP-binding protein